MIEKIMKEKGITIITLVITIVVLLILASISLIALTGEHGLLQKTNKAEEKALIARYEEALENIGNRMKLKKAKKEVTNQDYMQKYKEEIENDELFKDAKVTIEDEKTIRVVTKEGYIFIVTPEKVRYIEKDDDVGGGNQTGGNNSITGGDNTTGDNQTGGDAGTVPPDLKQSDIELIPSPSKLTNTDVTVQINVKISGYTIQYSKTGTSESDWKEYKTPVVMQQNGPIYVRLWNGTKAGGYTTGNILNIDKLPPNGFSPTATVTSNSITLSGLTTDQAMTSTNASSGIDKYYFSKDNGNTWEPVNGQTQTSYTFNGLTQNVSYNLKMKAVDKVGNEIITETITKTTGSIPQLTTSDITFTYTVDGREINKEAWTNKNVTVTASITNSSLTGYELRTSKDGKNWEDETSQTFSTNGTIYAVLYDGTNYGGAASGNVTNIDTTKPIIETLTESTVMGIGKLKGTNITDQGGSGIAGYYVSKTNTTPSATVSGWITLSSSSFEYTVSTNGTYYVWVKDNAGNVSNVKSCTVTGVIPHPTDTSEEVEGTTFSTNYGKIDIIWLKGTTDTVMSTPNAPVLTDGYEAMTPIIWNSSNNIATTSSTSTNWYNYSQKKWANARTANESYFVWIPRYAYRITYYESATSTTPTGYFDGYGQWKAETGEIRLKLDAGVNTVTYNNEKYIVHPAFEDNLEMGGWSNKLSGFWFAKFEMSLNNGKTVQSIYGVESERNKNIGELYTYARTADYSFIGRKDEVDGKWSYMNSHMTKNSEWGAVAYLAHSQYGRDGQEIKINSTYYTGGGPGDTYKEEISQSTTGNVYGVYDMSGGGNDFSAAYNSLDSYNYLTQYGWTEATGLTTESESTKYATRYNNITGTYLGNKVIYGSGKIGDATKEVNKGGKYNKDSDSSIYNWFEDYSGMLYNRFPLCSRGGGKRFWRKKWFV